MTANDGGAIVLSAGGRIDVITSVEANGGNLGADGVAIAASGDVLISGLVRSNGGEGTVSIDAAGDLTVTGSLRANGGFGTVDIGCTDPIGGDVLLRGDIEANGGDGTVSIEAATASVTANGDSGTIEIEAGLRNLTVAGTLTAKYLTNDDNFFNGDITLGPGCNVVLSGTLDSAGGGDFGSNEIIYLGVLDVSGGSMLSGAGGENTITRGPASQPPNLAPAMTIAPPALPVTVDVTLGSCQGCSNGVVESQPPFNELCDDGNVIDGDGCDSNCTPTGCGNGIATANEICDDGNTIQCDGCSPLCQPQPSGNPCDDGDACTETDVCTAGVCQGSPRSCDDGVSCTSDGCVVGQCINTPSSALCDDGDACTIDICDPAAGCSNSTDCDDGNACTLGDQCVGGACRGALRPACLSVVLSILDDTCGNGVVESTERCDDGNTADGDCCSGNCQIESSSVSCDDANPCTMGDVCQAGTCVGEPAPALGCHEARRGVVQLIDRSPDTKDKFSWKWLLGPTTSAEFGNPAAGLTSYDLCVYDMTGEGSRVAWHASIPGGGLCSGRPCWQAAGGNLRFADGEGVADGIEKILLRSGTDDNAKIVVTGKGAGLGLPALPLAQDPAVTVQFKSTDGECWTIPYEGPAVRSDAERFKDVYTAVP
jgi:cysteine-rich repeat protein